MISTLVILLMLDGVRWQEVFHKTVFDFMLKGWGTEAVLFGNRAGGDPMYVSNSERISLPAYQSIMAGSVQPCRTNTCGRIGVETVQERLVRELRLQPKDVATLASWNAIEFAVEHAKGATFVDTGYHRIGDGEAPPWRDARWDHATVAHAMRYLKENRPKFMFISLNDSDEWAHRGDYPRYLQTLRQYDAWVRELVQTLDGMGEYGKNATLLVTTDHGRGSQGDWTDHGPSVNGAEFVWLYGKNQITRKLGKASNSGYSHVDIRPTVEAALGLAPIQCQTCGRPMREFLTKP